MKEPKDVEDCLSEGSSQDRKCVAEKHMQRSLLTQLGTRNKKAEQCFFERREGRISMTNHTKYFSTSNYDLGFCLIAAPAYLKHAGCRICQKTRTGTQECCVHYSFTPLHPSSLFFRLPPTPPPSRWRCTTCSRRPRTRLCGTWRTRPTLTRS